MPQNWIQYPTLSPHRRSGIANFDPVCLQSKMAARTRPNFPTSWQLNTTKTANLPFAIACSTTTVSQIWGKGPLNPIIITIHRGINIVKILVLVIAIIHPESVWTVLAHPTIFRSHTHHSSVVLPLALILRTAWRQNFFIYSIFLVRYSANTSFDKFN